MRLKKHVECVEERRGLYRVLMGSLRYQLDDLSVNKVIRLICICKKWDGCTDWIDLAQGRDRWRVSVYAVMNFRVQ
jgi:hypothetical protein